MWETRKFLLLGQMFGAVIMLAVVVFFTSKIQGAADREQELKDEYNAAIAALQTEGDKAVPRIEEAIKKAEVKFVPGSPLVERFYAGAGEACLKIGKEKKDGRYLKKSSQLYWRALKTGEKRGVELWEDEIRYHLAIAEGYREAGALLRASGQGTRDYVKALKHFEEARRSASAYNPETAHAIARTMSEVRAEADIRQ